MRPEIQIKEDELQNWVGGYAPDANTATHFLGRQETETHIKTAKKKRTSGADGQVLVVREGRKKRIEEFKVAPGVVVAYEVPDVPDKAPNSKGLAQTDEAFDPPGSSLKDDRSLTTAEDMDLDPQETMNPAERDLSMGTVPEGDDLMTEQTPPSASGGPDIELGTVKPMMNEPQMDLGMADDEDDYEDEYFEGY